MKNFFIGIFLSLFCSLTSARPEKWMSARTLKELEKLIEEQKIKEEWKILCLLQLQKKTVPDGCYEWRSFMEKPSSSPLLSLPYLNEKCEESAKKVTQPEHIKSILQKQNLSPFCRKKIEEAKKLMEYQLRDQELKHILKWHSLEDF